MQHKVAGLWSSVPDPQSLTMADEGVEEVRCKTVGNNIVSSNESIVSSLLRKASSFRDELCVGGGLEQKIQELRAGKEASESPKCCSPSDNGQDSPIDFSVKRRSSFSGSLTDDSQTSSSSPGHMTDYNPMSPSAEQCGARDSPSPDPLERRLHDQEKGVPPLTMPHVLNNLNFFPGLASNLLANGSAMASFSHLAAAALKEPRHAKSNRPFKGYPKDALQMPLGLFGLPGMTPAALQQGMDLGLLMGVASDELLNIYHQQIQLARDSKFPGRGMKIPFNGKQMHHHYQHEKGYHSSPATTVISTSPPLSPPDQLRVATTPGSMAAHGSSSSASINASLVSSTSSFALSNSSRKRSSSLPDEQKDAAYWERRRKNNDAAKRSRDARRAKEDEIAMRAALLEQENLKLRVEVAALKTETERLRCMLYSN